MESRAKLFGHSIHQMLIVFPLGVLGMAAVFDVIYLVTRHVAWFWAAYHMIAAGVVAGLVAAIFGLIDWLAIPAGTRARRIGAYHGVGNVIVVLLFAISCWLRSRHLAYPGITPFVFSFLGLIIAVVTGWLGGELVSRLGVGVDDGAGLDAPSSLTATRAERSRVKV
jgi:uncharacterized membrane protein